MKQLKVEKTADEQSSTAARLIKTASTVQQSYVLQAASKMYIT